MIQINSIHLPFDHSDQELKTKILAELDIKEDRLKSYRIVKRSLDARKKRPLQRVYTISAEITDQESLREAIRKSNKISIKDPEFYQAPVLIKQNQKERPLVIGTGPAGLFSGLILAEAGLMPIMIERGKPVEDRARDVNLFWKKGELDLESNVQFGEGGAGTFSDGKLRTRVKDRSNRSNKILQELVKAGAPEEILYDHKPHVGTSNLVKVMINLRARIQELGGEYLFNTLVVDFIQEGGRISGVQLRNGDQIKSDTVILAIGHSARDTFEKLFQREVSLEPKPFSVGFRIEHPQLLIDRNQYGKHAGHACLGAADYQLAYKTSTGRSVYSFCMCPGGTVIASSSEENSIVTNGMSQYSRSEANANSAIVAEVFPDDYGKESQGGFLFQRQLEQKAYRLGGGDYFAPVQLVGDFMADKVSSQLGSVQPSYLPGFSFQDLNRALPSRFISAIKEALPAFNRMIPGFLMPDAVLTGVETRTSSPLRILRDESYQSVSLRGLYPVGEGSGYAGGIMSSAMDGIKAAEKIIEEINRS